MNSGTHIDLTDKIALEQAKYNKDINALQHQIVLLKIALKHGLSEGDKINDDMSISRKPSDEPVV